MLRNFLLFFSSFTDPYLLRKVMIPFWVNFKGVWDLNYFQYTCWPGEDLPLMHGTPRCWLVRASSVWSFGFSTFPSFALWGAWFVLPPILSVFINATFMVGLNLKVSPSPFQLLPNTISVKLGLCLPYYGNQHAYQHQKPCWDFDRNCINMKALLG